MLVRALKNNNKNEWDIICLTGPLFGEKVATVEGFRLTNARFQFYSLTGYLVAVHGAQIEEIAQDSAQIVRAIGLRGAFEECHREACLDDRNSGWFDVESLDSIIEAKFINGMGPRVFYSTSEDVTLDRQNMQRPESIVVPGPDWTASDYLKAGFSKLKEKIIGG